MQGYQFIDNHLRTFFWLGKTYGNLIRYGFFEDVTIELNNVYGWKRHNAQAMSQK